MSEDREMDRRVRAAAIAEDDGYADDHRRDQDDEPDDYDHDALRESELLTDAGGRHVCAVCGAPCWRCSAVREPAGTGGPGADQVEDEQQDGCAGDGGEPGGQVEEPVQGVDVEQAGGGPAAA